MLYPQILATVAASIGSLLMGAAIGWSGPALPLMMGNNNGNHKETVLEVLFGSGEFPVTEWNASLVGSFMPLGALFGSKFGSFPVHAKGGNVCSFSPLIQVSAADT